MRIIVPWRLISPFCLLLCAAVQAYELTGKVIRIADGDTLTILDAEHNQHKIRLADIDAPESGQPYGKRAKQHLQALAAGKIARADCREKDRYKRDVCTVYVDGVDLNAEMVQSGHAWVYERYNRRESVKERYHENPTTRRKAKMEKLEARWQEKYRTFLSEYGFCAPVV